MPEAVGDCGGCVACCTKCGVPPFQQPDEYAALPAELRAEIDAYWAAVGYGPPSPGPCLWLVNGGCAHYALRPEVCRTFEVDCDECRAFCGEVP